MAGSTAVGSNLLSFAKMMTDIVGDQKETDAAVTLHLRNSETLQRQAEILDFQEADAGQRGARAAGLARMEGTQVAAQQRAAYTMAGVDASVGTAADVQMETGLLTEMQVQDVTAAAAREAWGHRQSAAAKRVESGWEKSAVARARDAGAMKSIGHVLDFASAGMSSGAGALSGG